MVVAEAVGAGEKVYAFALEFVGIEHIPVGFIRVADIYERYAAEPRFREPVVKFGEPRLLIERVAELVETVFVNVFCGRVQLGH